MEYREYRAVGVAADDAGHVHGLVTPFDRETVIGDLKRGGFKETVRAGAFTKTLAEGDPLMVWQHRMDQPLARKSAGNLDLREGELDGQRGVVIDADPVDTSYARDMRALVKAKVVTGMSFGFEVVKDAWTDDDGNPSNRYVGTRRELLEVRMIEASPVTLPAYGGTVLQMRDAQTAALLEERGAQATDEERPEARVSREALLDLLNLEGRASSISEADRKELAKKGWALPDGSYPIPDEEHLHAAAVLAASKHGDYKAARALIRRRAKDLGVDVTTLPGFGEKKSEDADPELRDDPDGKEYEAIDSALRALRKTPPDVKGALALLHERQGQRDDPDGREFEAIDRAIRLLEENPPDVKGAKNVLSDNQMFRRSADQEPESSTPDDEDEFALRVAWREAEERSRNLGYV